jgi:Tat protein secretion system quality control protein TatD with DNase activity
MSEDIADNFERLVLVDSHAHLEELDDLPDSLQEAKAADVCGIIAVGMDIESNRKVLQKKWARLFP